MFLTENSVRRPIATLMLVLGITMGGIVSFFQLPVDMMPNSESSQITIMVGVRGGMPSEDIEHLVTEPIEEAVSTMAGLSEVLSVSRKDRCTVTLFFDDANDVKRAVLETSERLARIKGKLPKEIEKPIVARYNENDHPVVIMSATSSARTPEVLRGMIEKDLKPRLSRVPGVGNVEISGGRQRKILVEFEKSKLEMHTISILEVIQQLGSNNLSQMTGTFDKGRDLMAVEIAADFRTLDQMRDLPVAVTKQGSPIRLRDVAVVRDYYMEADSYARVNSQPSVSIYVQKESGANTIKVARGVLEEVRDYEKGLPRDIGIGVSVDQSVAIRQAISDVRGALTEGALLTGLVLWFFLGRLRQVGVIILSIPVAVLAAFFVMLIHALAMEKMGNPPMFTINVMSLLGIALGIGRMVDDSIVVFENILHHYEEAARKGKKIDTVRVAIDATAEMTLAVASSTLIMVVIFVPIVFFSQDIRRQFADVAFTVVVSLMASWLMAVTIIPLLASRLKVTARADRSDMFKWEIRAVDGIAAWWSRMRLKMTAAKPAESRFRLIPEMLERVRLVEGRSVWSVLAPWWLAALLCLEIVLIFLASPAMNLPSLPRKAAGWMAFLLFLANAGIIALRFRAWWVAVGMTYGRFVAAGTGWAVRRRAWVVAGVFASMVFSALVYVYKLPKEFSSGGDKNEFIIFVELPSGSKLDVSDKVVSAVESEINSLPEVKNVVKTIAARVEGWSSKIYVTLASSAERTRTVQDVIDTLRPRFKTIGGQYEAFIYFSEAQSSKELTIDLYGKDYAVLRDTAVEVAKRIQEVGGLRDVKLRYKPGQPEVRLEVDHARASTFGLSSKDIAETLHAQIRGMRATYFNAGNDQVETVARLTEEDRRTIDNVANLTFVSNTKKKNLVPIQQVIDFKYGYTPSEVWRRNKERVIQVSANREKLALSTVVERCQKALKEVTMPIGYHYEFGGDYKKLVESEKEFATAFLVMTALVYIVLACFFESYSQPFLMLLTIPLATAGSMPTLWATKTPVNMGVYIGFLMLGGTVTSNAVILIDRLNQVRQSRSLLKSVLTAGIERSRPIFMTSLCTIAAMLPLTLERGESAEMWAPLSLTVVSGIAVSSVLTLFVVPAAYVMLEVFSRNVIRYTKGQATLRDLWREFRRDDVPVQAGVIGADSVAAASSAAAPSFAGSSR